MTERETIRLFSADLERLVNRYAREFEMEIESAIGCLQMEAAKLINQHLNPELYENDD